MWLTLAALTTSLLLLLHDTAASTTVEDIAKADLPETILEVRDQIPRRVTSPGFPECCKPAKYKLQKAATKHLNHMNWKLLFSDLDLTPNSQLLIYGIKRPDAQDKELIGAATYLNGAWISPVVVYDGFALLITFYPADQTLSLIQENTDESSNYVGFKGKYWLEDDSWEVDKPFTICPPIGDGIQSNRVQLNDLELPFDAQHYRMYCVWQIKPIPGSDLQLYIKLEELSGDHSKIKIHQGLTSESTVVYSTSGINASQTFTSDEGFYIVLSKPAKGGTFTMSNGVLKSLMKDKDCVFIVDGKSIQGFKCEEETQDWCIPDENKCDQIHDCPSGFDESPGICTKPLGSAMRPTTMSYHSDTENCHRERCEDGRCPKTYSDKCPEQSCGPLGRRCPGTLLCLTKYQSCPGEKCTSSEKRCQDGSCVLHYERCRDTDHGCKAWEKRCSDGRCLTLYKRCPEEPCPVWKPFTCDGKCNFQSHVCNGWEDCADGSDEHGCYKVPQAYKSYQTREHLVFLFIAVIVILVGFCCYGAYKGWCFKGNQRPTTDLAAVVEVLSEQTSRRQTHQLYHRSGPTVTSITTHEPDPVFRGVGAIDEQTPRQTLHWNQRSGHRVSPDEHSLPTVNDRWGRHSTQIRSERDVSHPRDGYGVPAASAPPAYVDVVNNPATFEQPTAPPAYSEISRIDRY